MARSRSLLAPVALLGVVGYALAPWLAAFVVPSAPVAAPHAQLRRRVSLAATAADVEAALKKLELQKWAAATLAKQGSPEAAAAQARAQQAEQAYLAVKAQAEGAAPPPPPPSPPAAAAPAPAAPAPVAGAPVAEDVAAAKKKASLMAWAAKTLVEKGAPQAAEMQARAARKLQEYESLKAAFEGRPAAAPAAAAPAPVATAPAAAAAPAVAGVPTKAAVAEAKSKADLIAWAAKALIEKGAPQAAAMQAKADAKMQIYQSLKAAYEQGAPAAATAAAPAPAPAAAPAVAAAPTAAALGGEVPTVQEVEKFKKEAELMAWAARALVEKGAPQAAEMQAKAQQKMQTYETLKALAQKR